MQWLASVCIRQSVLTWVLVLTTIVVGALREQHRAGSDRRVARQRQVWPRRSRIRTSMTSCSGGSARARRRADRGEQEISEPPPPIRALEQAS